MPSVSSKKKSGKVEKRSPEQISAGSAEATIFKVLVILLAGLFIYAPIFHADWLWDDDQEITANAILPDAGGLGKIWSGQSGADYLPLKSTAQWLLYRVFQADRTGWHLTNVFFHLANAFLIWRLLARLGLRQAWLGGLLFVIHPILVESVAWVSELKNTLSLPLLLFSMFAWLNFEERERWSDYVWALVSFVASVLCKGSVIMYPCVILLYCWWKRGRISLSDGLRSMPFFAVSLIMGIVTIYFQHGRAIGSEIIPIGNILTWQGFQSRVAIAGVAMLFYFWKSILPFGLLPIYPRWEVEPPAWYFYLAWPAIALVLLWLWTKRKTWGRHVLFGLGFFLITLFPVLGFITMSYMRITWVADHFLYLPVIGLIGLATAVVGELYEHSNLKRRRYLLTGGLAIFTLLVFSSHRYAGIFYNEEAMWTYTLKSNPDAWQAHSRLGKVMIEKGNNDAAYYHISESVRLRPDLAETHNNMGAMLEKKGETEKALMELRTASRIAPDITIYRINLGSLLVRMGQYQEGSEVYEGLLEKDPNNPTFLCNYGVALYFLGSNDEAIEKFQRALKINPELKDARENLQAALKKKSGIGVAPAEQPQPPGSNFLGGTAAIQLFGN